MSSKTIEALDRTAFFTYLFLTHMPPFFTACAMNVRNLANALDAFITDDVPVLELALILSLFSDCERVTYRQLASTACSSLDEALLTLWEWKLVIPVRSSQCSEWDSRILLAQPQESYEMPNISKTLVKKGGETGKWESSSAILDLFQSMGEPEWKKMPLLTLSIKNNTLHNTINGAKINALCIQNGLEDKAGAMIAVLKGAGIISPKLAAVSQVAKSRSPLYEFNPCVYAEL